MLASRRNAPGLCRSPTALRRAQFRPNASTLSRQLPNEAVNLLKTNIAHFQKSSKAVNLLKIQPLAHIKPSTD